MPYNYELRFQVMQNIQKSLKIIILFFRQRLFFPIHTCMSKAHLCKMLNVIIESKMVPIFSLLIWFHTILCSRYI